VNREGREEWTIRCRACGWWYVACYTLAEVKTAQGERHSCQHCRGAAEFVRGRQTSGAAAACAAVSGESEFVSLLDTTQLVLGF
jgi:hypothetical protein